MKDFNLSEWGLNHGIFIIFCMILSVFLGVVSYFQLGRAEDPSLVMKEMVIDVYWPGATAVEMEEQVVEKIQRGLQEIPNYDYVTSYSRPEHATLFFFLKDWTRKKEIDEGWYQVRKKLKDIHHTLPKGIVGPFSNDDFGDTFGSIYAFHSDGFDDAKMKEVLLAVREHLLRLPDVSKVQLLGIQEQRFYIEFSHARLAELGISPQQIFAVIENQNSVLSSGVIEGSRARINMRLNTAIHSKEDLEKVVIESGEKIFKLGDIAKIKQGFIDPPVMSMRLNKEQITGLAISMKDGGDILRLGEQLDITINNLQKKLPLGITIEKIIDQPYVVKHSVNEFLFHFLLALCVVLIVSLFILGLRPGLIVALSIPLVLGISFFIMWCLDINLQRVSLGTLIIALGLLVDDAIIAIEMIQVKMEEGWERIKAASYAWNSTAFPMLTGTLITAAGFVPVGFASSSTSEYTESLFWVLFITLLVSWLAAVIFIPFLGMILLPEIPVLKEEKQSKTKHYSIKFQEWISDKIIWCVKHNKLVIVFTVCSFILSLIAFSFVEQQFFPDSPREEILVDISLEEGASYLGTLEITKEIENLIATDDRIKNIIGYVGMGSPRFYLTQDIEIPKLNFAQLIIYPQHSGQSDSLTKDIREKLSKSFADIRTRVYRLEMGPPVGYPIQFRVSGADRDIVRNIAEQVRDKMREHPNVRDINFQWYEKIKSIRLNIDQAKAKVIGVNTQEIANSLQTLLTGYTITQARNGIELVDVVARAVDEERMSADKIGNLSIYTAKGKHVPLSQIVTIEPILEEGGIWTRNRLPTINVRADVVGAQAPDVSKQINKKLLETIHKNLPTGYFIEMGGDIEERVKADTAIQSVVPLMIFLWLIFLMIQLQSFNQLLIVCLTAPLGMIGVTIALLITNTPFGFVASLGFLALAGMIMRNSIILVDQIDKNIRQDKQPKQAIITATSGRVRPVVLTALTAILAMIPLTTSVLWGPMAISMMGGLAVATILTLFFVPALYAAWFRIK